MKYSEFYHEVTKKQTKLSDDISAGIDVVIEEWRVVLNIFVPLNETDFKYLLKEMAEMDYYLCNVICDRFLRLVFSVHELYKINE